MKKFKKLEWHEIAVVALLIVQVTLFLLKTAGVVALSWWIIVSPLLLCALCAIVLTIIVIVLCALVGDDIDE